MVESNDTALSAREIKEKHIKHRAAVASKRAAELFGLEIIAADIHDNKRNFTRFLILAQRHPELVSGSSSASTINKSSISFRDTIRDTNTVTTLDTLCMNVNPGMNADTVIITNCNGGPLTTVNTYNTLANGCIEIVRSTTVGYNVDTLCVIVRDTTKGIDDTTTVIISNTPKVDTIRDTNVVNTTDTLCITLEPGMTGGDIEVNFCGHVNNSGNIYTAIPNSNCVEIVRGNTVGFSLDTICIIITDPITGIKDTTIGIISNIPNPCPDVIRDTVLSCNANDSAGLCIALNLANIRKYNIFIDGTKSAQQFSSRTGCGQTLVDAGFNISVMN